MDRFTKIVKIEEDGLVRLSNQDLVRLNFAIGDQFNVEDAGYRSIRLVKAEPTEQVVD